MIFKWLSCILILFSISMAQGESGKDPYPLTKLRWLTQLLKENEVYQRKNGWSINYIEKAPDTIKIFIWHPKGAAKKDIEMYLQISKETVRSRELEEGWDWVKTESEIRESFDKNVSPSFIPSKLDWLALELNAHNKHDIGVAKYEWNVAFRALEPDTIEILGLYPVGTSKKDIEKRSRIYQERVLFYALGRGWDWVKIKIDTTEKD
jgi:hypothetical protein